MDFLRCQVGGNVFIYRKPFICKIEPTLGVQGMVETPDAESATTYGFDDPISFLSIGWVMPETWEGTAVDVEVAPPATPTLPIS